MDPNRRGWRLAALTALVVGAACASDVAAPPGGQAALSIRADVSATSVALVVVQVTGAGISAPLTFNLTIVGGVASGTITIPAGSARTITLLAYDAGGIETHQGSLTLNVSAGTNPPASVVLTALTGDTPITATLSSIGVSVTPPTATVAAGGTVALTAALTLNGTPVVGTVTWATSNPGIATVGSNGVVTGVSAGQVSIVATFQGVAGSSTVTVTGP